MEFKQPQCKSNLVRLTCLLSAVFWLCVSPVHAQSDGGEVGLTIQQVWNDSHELETFLGMGSLAALSENSEVEGVSRDVALRLAEVAAQNLKAGLRDLSALKRRATPDEKLAIDGVELVAYGRIGALSAILAGPGGGGSTIVTSCTGAWDCFGFGTACKAAGGTWEEWGAGAETCTN